MAITSSLIHVLLATGSGVGQAQAANQQVLGPTYNQWIPLLLTIIVALGLAFATWLMGTVIGPRQPSERKNAPFEFGNPSYGWGGKRFSIKYYMVGISFLLFDLEAAFVFPWAVRFRETGFYGFMAITVFLGLITLGLVYEWWKGALEWD